MLFSTTVDPHWTPDGKSFWYSYKTGNGTSWYVVDATTRRKRPLFDRSEIAAQLTEIVKDPFVAQQLPIEGLRAMEDGTYTFQVTSSQETKKKDKDGKPKRGKEVFYFSYNPSTNKLTQIDRDEPEKFPGWASISPDGQTVVFAKDLNLYRMSRADYEKTKTDEKDSTIVETQLTTFGVKDFGFGQPYSLLNTDTLCDGKRKGVWIQWSPDSKHFAVEITDKRDVKELWVINSMANPRPTLETYKYQMPGEKEAPKSHLYVFNMDDNTYKEVNTSAYKDQTIGVLSKPRQNKDRDRRELSTVWLGENNGFYLERASRDLHRIDICRYELGQDTIVPLIEERMNTYIETRPLALANGGKDLIHWSERNGWAHLYLYGADGKLKNPITSGDFHVMNILKVDDKTKTVYFTANGKGETSENPYYQHLYRVGFDGSGLKEISKGDFYHEPYVDDNCAYFVDNYSRVNTVPKTGLFDNMGNKIMDLEESDFSQLFAAGYQFPEPFKVKAADGVTDLYGVMYKPFDFDSTKVYPIIDYVYPGPQVEATNYPFTRMTPRTDRLAQAGFIVITVGNRGGHPNRSKWYHNYGYGNLRDYGLADQRAAIIQLAREHKYIDVDRVGIHGHSGGGFMSTAAILQYPDFFKVAVSCAGNHDNRIYNRWWSETHHGVKEQVSEKGDTTFVYNIETNPAIAQNLKGHLLLIHGDIDNNVHPGNSLRVVNALIRAGKRFDMLILPQQRHGFGDMNEYFYWRLVDYFSEYLLGEKETSVDIPWL
jgi:dipeptidyl aminopeptidase/acylaminoacyl peptidase